MTFKEFLALWMIDGLGMDPTWRNYDIPGSAKPSHVKLALKELGFSRDGELAVSHFAHTYGISTTDEAEKILGCWYLWQRFNSGRRGLRMRKR